MIINDILLCARSSPTVVGVTSVYVITWIEASLELLVLNFCANAPRAMSAHLQKMVYEFRV